MSTIFSKVKLKGRQIAVLSVLVLFAAIAEMMLPSLLAQMINNGVADSSRSAVLSLAAVMTGVTGMYRQFLVRENCFPHFHRLFSNTSWTGF